MDFESLLKSVVVADVLDESLVSILESCPISPAWDLLAKQFVSGPHLFDFGVSAYAAALKHETESASPCSSASSSSSSNSRAAQVPQQAVRVKMEADSEAMSSEASAPSSPSSSDASDDAEFEQPTRTKVVSKAKATRGERGATTSKKAGKRTKWSRSHTRKEPTPDEFSSEEEYEQAWRRWRELRDNNNNAVKRSRENKKRLLPTQCRQQKCIHLHHNFESLQKKMSILVKAIRSPKELTAHERREYEAILSA